MKLLSIGMAFCDIPLRPCPQNILKLDNWHIDPVKHQIGGDAMTVAVVGAKMGEEVRIATHLGDDNNGEFVRQSSEAFGVEHVLAPIKNMSTATSYQLIEANGERHFLVDNEILKLLKSKDIPDEEIHRADVVFFGSALALPGMDDQELTELFRRAHGKGKITAMDASVNVADYPPCHLDLLRSTMFNLDIFIPSYEEASWLAQKTEVMDIMEVFSQFPFRVFGIKLGADGCILTEKFRDYVRKEPFSVLPVVDTTGAGDCFMGGFLCAWMKGWSLEKCAEFGSAVAAFGISAVGPSTAVPDYGTVFSFLKKHATGW